MGVDLKVNAEKTNYMFIHINGMQDSIKTKVPNRSFEIVAKYKYLGTTLTNQNCNYKSIF
jgi:hypothetical protein